VTLGEEWSRQRGAFLDLGEFVDTARVTVNGKVQAPVDPAKPIVDIGRGLRPGANVIEVEIASTLYNRLHASRPDVFFWPGKQYGLMGPVRLIPYAYSPVRQPR
jgi:hypothetical protein